MSRVWVWPNFKNTLQRGSHEHPIEQTEQIKQADQQANHPFIAVVLVRGSHEHPIEQTKQTVKAKSSYQSQQRNANQSKMSKGSW